MLADFEWTISDWGFYVILPFAVGFIFGRTQKRLNNERKTN